MDPTPNKDNESDQLEGLDTPSTTVVPDSEKVGNNTDNPVSSEEPLRREESQPYEGSKKRFNPLSSLIARFNIYLLAFVVVFLIALAVTGISYYRSQQQTPEEAIVATEPLSQDVLDQLKESDLKVGDPKQVLSVEANAIFSGTVLVRGGLEVAGQIKVGGPLSLPGITVSGASNFDEVQINNLQIAGNTTVQGQLNVQGNISSNGSATFGGTLSAARLTIQDFQTSGDIKFSGHLDAGGGTPSRSNGNALGGGGTSSVSVSDTAGTVNINTGSNPHAGCFATISFARRFNDTPHVVVTPLSPAAANLKYYVTRSSSNFSICTANAAPGGRNLGFDYIVIN
jgi:hypothetical protein